MIKTLIFTLIFPFASIAAAMPEGKIESPFEACKNVVIVSKEKFQEKKEEWEKYEKSCNTKVQLADEAGFSSLDPLKEGVQYLSFSQQVAGKVLENLKKSQAYADCSSLCFEGALSCQENKQTIECSKRKKDIQESMKVYSRRIRMELALSNDAPGLINVNIANVLNVDKEKFINSNLRDFEAGIPNPLGRTNLSERENKEALRRLASERNKLEQEFTEKGYKNYSDWMSVKLMQNFDEHRSRYRALVYEEAPIFGVIEKPIRYEDQSEPVWSDAQVASAFKKLSANSASTQRRVNSSIKKSKLEFSRYNGEALGQWISSLAPGESESSDLLFYMGMKNQVEEVLKNDPSSCAIATTMEARLRSKEMQNAGITFTATLFSAGALKGASTLATNTFRIGRALSGAEAAGLTGMALGGVTLTDSFNKYATTTEEAATRSGLAKEREGSAITSSENVKEARSGVVTSLAFVPLDAIGGWTIGKTLYSSLSKQMIKDIPEYSHLAKSSALSPEVRDQLVDQWLVKKVKDSFKSGSIDGADLTALESKESQKALASLTTEIEKKNPQFFKNPKNVDFYLKTAATMIRKDKSDPTDLGVKAKELLFKFNTEAMDGSWNPQAQSGLVKVFNSAIEELRLAAKTDPATYAKFNTDPKSQEKLMMSALRKSGVTKERDAKDMLQCALPL